MFESTAGHFGDRPAVIEDNTETTYAELFDQARVFGVALVNAGVHPGDRVAIWSFNCREWIVACLGLLQAGAAVIPVNTRFKGAEAADILLRGRARALVTVGGFLGSDYPAMLSDTTIDLPDLHTIVIARGASAAKSEPWAEFLARGTNADLAEFDRRRRSLGPDDVSDVLFTSGTTGVPKGVLMTHGRSMGVGTDWVAMTGLSAGDRYLMVNPYFHMFGLKAGILACLASGATMLPEAVFDVDHVLARVAEQKVTFLPGAPTIYRSILDHPSRDRYDLSSLKVAVTGAADIPVELIRQVRAELPFQRIIAGYGLTESGTAASTAPDDDPETIATTVGRARPGFDIRVVDADGQWVAPGEVGEILLHGPTIMAGYADDPAGTAAVLSPDGWLHTGDLGFFDERGCLRIAGRSKDMFIVGGFNAYPAEIETIMLRHPAIAQVAVIGVPDPRLGQVGMAFIVAKPDAVSPDAVTPAGLIAWCRQNMANYKAPRFVEIVDALPLNATGKVQKEELRLRAARRR
jgi:acyl-CoA synthetase (AMP-forming)/AMP-acid ligase II